MAQKVFSITDPKISSEPGHRPERNAVAHVAVQQVAFHLTLSRHVQHVARYVQSDPAGNGIEIDFWQRASADCAERLKTFFQALLDHEQRGKPVAN